ncbi:hypothetical protein [Luteibacter sp. 22Crub2.1]|uniref:hypothetical protein n=1 Tax=Luteibacter sp. 22Crub2.1 TaxID=1283288 RepID=UPI0009A711A8|nr:hypothetical protein [Luteibacter sp. 22Crub2.1]SKB50874.1 hypothetical protein SAMN05660880_01382 [Luteibacter sp. 22Crub2.1]
MTTVCYDGTSLAADSQIGGTFKHTQRKLVTLPDGSFAAGAGTVADIQAFLRALVAGEDQPEGEYDVLVSHLDGRVVHYDSYGMRLDVTGRPYAVGSGAQFAMGAMAAGKSAKRAAEIACGLDESSGRPVHTVKVHTAPEES